MTATPGRAQEPTDKIHREVIALALDSPDERATAPPVAAQKVYVDYDGATAFSQFRTFQLVETRQDQRNKAPGVHRDVVSAGNDA